MLNIVKKLQQQQQSPYYPTNMIQHWAHHPAGAYYATEIGGLFSVNGLAPQGAFTKPQNSRYNVSRAPYVIRKLKKLIIIFIVLTKFYQQW